MVFENSKVGKRVSQFANYETPWKKSTLGESQCLLGVVVQPSPSVRRSHPARLYFPAGRAPRLSAGPELPRWLLKSE